MLVIKWDHSNVYVCKLIDYINNERNKIFPSLFRWILLETLDKVSPGIVNWKIANKPPIKMPFRKVENCNQVVKIGKQLKFSLVNIAGNDIVQGNKKLILGKPPKFVFC